MSWFRRKRQLTDRERALLAAIDESERLQAYRQGYMDGMTAEAGRLINGERFSILGTPVRCDVTWDAPAEDRAYFDEQVEAALTRYRESQANPYEKLNAGR